MAPTPLDRPKIIKKRTNRFIRHQSDLYKRLHMSWRRPKGIDNTQRRRFKGTQRMPRIGYGSAQKTKYRNPDGFYPFVVTNTRDLEMLLMHNRKYSAVIAHNLSIRKRKKIVTRAAQLNVKVANAGARLSKQEHE